MSLSISIESPVTPEATALVEASQSALLEVFAPEEIFSLSADELARPEVTFLVARDGGRPMGCVAMVDHDGYAEVKRLYVAPATRNRGIARALMDRLESLAVERGLTLIRLETGPALIPATALYAARGYAPRGPFGGYADHPASRFMEKVL